MDTSTSRGKSRERLPGGRPTPSPREDPVGVGEADLDQLGPDPTPDRTPDLTPSPGLGGYPPPGPITQRPGSDTRTGTSSAGRPSAKEIAGPIAGILGLLAGGVAFAIAWRYRRQFRVLVREPTDVELDELAEPLARIAHRHINAEWLHPDLLDGLAAGNAVRRYLNAGPLLAVVAEPPTTQEETS